MIGLCGDASRRDPLLLGLTDLDTLDRVGGVVPDTAFADGVGALIASRVQSFALFAVLGQPLLSRGLRFLSAREWEWNLTDRLAFAGSRQIIAGLPRQGAQLVNGNPRADYAVVDVVGGDYTSVLADSRGVWQAANAVEVKGSADVLVTPVWGPSIDPVDAIGSPLDAAHHALVTRAGSHLEAPLARPGGALIAFHPCATASPTGASRRRPTSSRVCFPPPPTRPRSRGPTSPPRSPTSGTSTSTARTSPRTRCARSSAGTRRPEPWPSSPR
ncbi:hypothetical protein G7085_19820 [Tessaracoccus sp. HDW20]|uniref:hypothetical protein n=1 Tax=Tessaracoccus coleopterorum TaxID=2714950 RepID=UPI0018D3C599|nr:hypothetical protein [Tessaracoccus coleopterorum]NHB86022.1 hypothetical protein [Tessaracoccus coleopterorum]